MSIDTDEDQSASRADSLSVIGVVISCAALIATVIGVGLSFEKVDKAKEILAGSTASQATVTLSEFKITPATVLIGAGGSLQVTNGALRV